MKTKKLVLYALFIAIHVVLCYASINLGNMKITISGLPIIIGAMLFGPMAGLEIGLLGSLLNQLLTYGLTLTTVLWIIPAGVRGFMIGAYAKHKKFNLSFGDMIVIIVVSALVVTTINTAVMYIDSKIYGYYSYAYVFGALIPRYISAILTSAVYMIVVPTLMKYLKRAIEPGVNKGEQ